MFGIDDATLASIGMLMQGGGSYPVREVLRQFLQRGEAIMPAGVVWTLQFADRS